MSGTVGEETYASSDRTPTETTHVAVVPHDYE